MLDAILISDSGTDTYSASSSLRLQMDGKPALIQNILNFLENDGTIVDPVIGADEKNWHCAPKLNGIVLLSHLLKQGLNVELIDSFHRERNRFIDLLEDQPKAIIISTTFILNQKSLDKLVRDIRSVAGEVFIIAGGPFVNSSYQLMQRIDDQDYDTTSPSDDFLFLSQGRGPDVDLYIIDSGGEQILSEALHRIRTGYSARDLPNTAHWNGQRHVFSERCASQPHPEIRSVDWQIIPDRLFRFGAMNVQASHGCPYQCEFCNFVREKKDCYLKPMDTLVAELVDLSEKGIKYVRFVDDNFRLGKNDLNDVCRKFIEGGVTVNWMSFIRASTLNNTDLELLKRAGCIEVQIGIESADRTVLENMNKQADPKMYRRVMRNLLDAGINCSCCFLVGFPGETAESFQATLDFIESIPSRHQSGIFSWSFYPFMLAPLSPIYEPSKRAKYGLTGYMHQWKHKTMQSDEARGWVKKAFFQIKNSGPVYTGDNLEMLNRLSSQDKKRFIESRFILAKRSLKGSLDKSTITETFSSILSA